MCLSPTRPHAMLTYTLALSNTGPLTATYALAVESSLTPTLSLTQTPLLAPDAALALTLAVSSPVATTDAMTVTARSLRDGGTTDWANITTTVTSAFTPTVLVRLPLAVRNAP